MIEGLIGLIVLIVIVGIVAYIVTLLLDMLPHGCAVQADRPRVGHSGGRAYRAVPGLAFAGRIDLELPDRSDERVLRLVLGGKRAPYALVH